MNQNNLEWTLTYSVNIPFVTTEYGWGAFGEMGSYSGIWLINGVDLSFTVDPAGNVSGDTSYVIPPGINQEVTVSFTVNVADSLEAGYDFNFLGLYGSTPPLEWNWGAVTNPVFPVARVGRFTLVLLKDLSPWFSILS